MFSSPIHCCTGKVGILRSVTRTKKKNNLFTILKEKQGNRMCRKSKTIAWIWHFQEMKILCHWIEFIYDALLFCQNLQKYYQRQQHTHTYLNTINVYNISTYVLPYPTSMHPLLISYFAYFLFYCFSIDAFHPKHLFTLFRISNCIVFNAHKLFPSLLLHL